LNYRLLDTPWKAQTIAAMVEDYLSSIPQHGWPNWVLGSHDKKRIASMIGPDQARISAMLLFTLPGTAICYAGDELGMSGGSINAEPAHDPFERQVPGYGLNRDPERTPMQWDGCAHAGFTSGKPWLPVGPDYVLRNVEVEQADKHSILNLYRRLMALRCAEPVLATGEYKTVQVCGGVFAYTRRDRGRRILIALNVSARRQRCQVPCPGGGRILLSTQLDRVDNVVRDPITLASHEGVIILLPPKASMSTIEG
jgi:alpha-glucosidase